MADGTGSECLFEADLGANRKRIRIRDVDAFQQWVGHEVQFWNWLQSKDFPANYRFLTNHFNNAFNEASPIVTQADNLSREDIKQKLKSFLAKYKNDSLLHSSDPEACFVSNMFETGAALEAAVALSMILKNVAVPPRHTLDVNNFRIWQGIVSLVLYREGISERAATSHRNSLEKIAQEYSMRLSADSAAADELRARLDELVIQYRAMHERDEADRVRFGKVVRRLVRRRQTAIGKDLNEFKALLADGLSLDAPVKYWHEKSVKHQKSMRWLFGAFGVYVVGVALVGEGFIGRDQIG